MKISRILFVGLVVSFLLVSNLQAVSVADTYRKASASLALLEFSVEGPFRSQNSEGMALCVKTDSSGRAVFMTTVIPSRIRPDMFKNFRVTPANLATPAQECEFMGVDPLSGLGFVRTVKTSNWPVVNIPDKSGVKIAQRIMAVGLSGKNFKCSVQMSLAYVGGVFNVPEKIYRVTGGTLYGSGSIVFDMNGNVVGLVGRQLPEQMTISTGRMKGPVVITDSDRKMCFMDVSEFSHALKNMPTPQNPVKTAWIGVVDYNGITKKTSSGYGLNAPAVMVGSVVPGKTGAAAGLKQRDLILAVNGQPLGDFELASLIVQDLMRKIQRAGVGSTLKLDIARGSQQTVLSVKVDAMPKQAWQADINYFRELGIMAREKVEMDVYLDRGPTAGFPGIFVTQVAQKSPAEKAGLKANDLVVAVNKQGVRELSAMKSIIEQAEKDAPIELLIKRGTEDLTIKITK